MRREATISARTCSWPRKLLGSTAGFIKSFFTRSRSDRSRMRAARCSRPRCASASRAGFPRDVEILGQPVVLHGVTDLPKPERFFAGGDTTVRGFALDRLGRPDTIDEDGLPIGGNAETIFNVELRGPVRGGIQGVGFVDTGNVFAHASDLDLATVAHRRRIWRSLQVAGRPDPLRPRIQDPSRAGGTPVRLVHYVRTGVLTGTDEMHECTNARMHKCRRDAGTHVAARTIRAFLHLCILAFVLIQPVSAEVIDRVLAVVGGSLITLTDVNASLRARACPAARRRRSHSRRAVAADRSRAAARRSGSVCAAGAVQRPTSIASCRTWCPGFRRARCLTRSSHGPESTWRICVKRCARTCASAPTSISVSRPGDERRAGRRRLGRRSSAPRRHHRSLSGRPLTHPGSGTSRLERTNPSRSDELQDLQEIEPCVAHHRCDHRAPPQIHDAPERPEHARDDTGVKPLNQMSGAKRDAGDDDANRAAAEP